MTDELAGGAPAPAESNAAPEIQSNVPEPITESTPRGAIDRAFAAVESSEPAKEPVKTEASEPAGDRARNPDGTFAAKAEDAEPVKAEPAVVEAPKAETTGAAPARFASDKEASAAWASTPEPVKAATLRTIGELEQGIEKYRGDATAYNDTFKPFVDLAIASKVDPKATLQNYIAIDQLLVNDFDKGIAQIFQNKGADLKTFAAKVMGQAPQPQDQTIAELRSQIAELKQGFAGVHQTIEQQRSQGINQSLESFTATLPPADQALFNELDVEIAAYLRDPSTTLADAFAKAKQDATVKYQRMFGAPAPAPSTTPAAAQTRAPAPDAQTIAKGSLSVSGAPSSGSDPASRKPPSSPREALDRAFASAGL